MIYRWMSAALACLTVGAALADELKTGTAAAVGGAAGAAIGQAVGGRDGAVLGGAVGGAGAAVGEAVSKPARGGAKTVARYPGAPAQYGAHPSCNGKKNGHHKHGKYNKHGC